MPDLKEFIPNSLRFCYTQANQNRFRPDRAHAAEACVKVGVA